MDGWCCRRRRRYGLLYFAFLRVPRWSASTETQEQRLDEQKHASTGGGTGQRGQRGQRRASTAASSLALARIRSRLGLAPVFHAEGWD